MSLVTLAHLLPFLALGQVCCATQPALPAAPPPSTSLPVVAQPGVAPAALLLPGIFQLHIDGPAGVPLTEHLGITGTHYGVASLNVTESTRRVCVSPCDVVIDARADHELTLDATAFPAPRAFRLPGQGGNLTLFVIPGNDWGLTAGRWTTALGALAFGYGVIAVAFDYRDGPAPLTGANAEAVGLLAAGAVALAGGIVLLVTQHTRIRFAPGASAPGAAGAVSF